MRWAWQVADFIRALRREIRFGELSRAPIQPMRLEVRGKTAECDWIARSPDQWDDVVKCEVSKRNVSIQALQDAIAIRELIFSALPEIDTASLRVFRRANSGETELIIVGTVSREQQAPKRISSVAMRAKLLGLQFWLEDGILEILRSEECAMSF